MSEPEKDFRYYANRAEEQLQLSLGHEANGKRLLIDSDTKTRYVMRAHVYAVLAAGVHQGEPAPKSQFFYFVNGQRVEGERCFAQRFANPLVDPANSQCIRNHGHEGEHETANGARFDSE